MANTAQKTMPMRRSELLRNKTYSLNHFRKKFGLSIDQAKFIFMTVGRSRESLIAAALKLKAGSFE